MNSDNQQSDGNNAGVNINVNNGSMSVGGNIVGRDNITHTENLHQDQLAEVLLLWHQQMIETVEKTDLLADEKAEINKQIELIKSNIEKDKSSNPKRLEKLINILSIMSPDIFDVATSTLINPLAGIGLVIKKINDKAKLESQ